jgi:hypothetical protein
MESTTIAISLDVLISVFWGLLFLVITGPIAFILKTAVADQKELERDLNKLKTELPKVYIRREDYLHMLEEYKSDSIRLIEQHRKEYVQNLREFKETTNKIFDILEKMRSGGNG